MLCINHSDFTAAARCHGCSEPFCGNCLVNIQGQLYCASCKVMAVPDLEAALSDEQPVLDEARTAFILSIVGIACLFCCLGIIISPIALIKAQDAKRRINADSSIGGEEMATAALVIASIGCLMGILGIIAYFAT